MTSENSQEKIVCILGPTGAGKTDASLSMADAFKGAIINFDSRQVYKGLEIVTAQPSAEEQARCPHHLYGMLDPCQSMSAGSFTVMAEGAIAEVAGQGMLPILVGGTGLYLDSLLYGLAPIPNVPDIVRQQISAAWEYLGSETMYGFLRELDPDYAAKIHQNDKQRVCRALEIFESTGRVMSSFHQEQQEAPARYDALKIGIWQSLDELTPRLGLRIDKMLEMGAADEMRQAFKKCPKVDAPGYSGIGSLELLEFINDRMTLEHAKSQWLKRTRAYAKRQITWFKKDSDVQWFAPDDIDGILKCVGDWLKG